MTILYYIIGLLLAGVGVLTGLTISKTAKLKSSLEKLDSKTVELATVKQEMEVIREVKDKITASKEKKKPEKTESAASGDSDSRLNRLNRVSDTDKS